MYGLDDQQLHALAADHLDRRLLPLLGDPAAKAEAEALVRILRRARFGREVDEAAARGFTEHADGLGASRDALAASVVRMTGAPASVDGNPGPAATEEALSAHLRRRFADPGLSAANVVEVMGGFSKQTVLFDKVDADGRVERLVLRRDYPDSPVETSVRDEFPAVCDLHAAGIAVPEPLWLDEGSDAMPGPFLVSRRVRGTPLGDPAAGASADLAFDPTELLAGKLAEVHAVPLDAMTRSGLSGATWDVDALRAQIDYWDARYRTHAAGRLPVLDAAFGWLRESATRGVREPVIVHGDYGLHNILVDEGRFVALVDWELVHVGSAAWDLAYVRDHVRKLGTYERFVEGYDAAGGAVPPQEAIDYFQVFAFARTITMTLVVLALFNRGQLGRIPLIDVAQMIYPAQMSALADELASR